MKEQEQNLSNLVQKLHYIFKETEELGQIASIYYLQFKNAELLW